MRRIAVNAVICEKERIEPAVIEIVGDRVERFFQLPEELSMTEWIGGEVIIQGKQGELRAYKDGQLLAER
jgi:hypothetical protein